MGDVPDELDAILEEFSASGEDEVLAGHAVPDYVEWTVGIAERGQWLISFADEEGVDVLGAWPAADPNARESALAACYAACREGYWLERELCAFAERNGSAPWLNGYLAGLLADYDPDALVEGLEEERSLEPYGALYTVPAVPDAAEVIRRLQRGLPPTTDEERSFAWDLTSALEVSGRRIGEKQAPWTSGNLARLLASYDPEALFEDLGDDDEGVYFREFPDDPEVIRRLQSGLPPTTDDERSFAWDLSSALGRAEQKGRRIGEE